MTLLELVNKVLRRLREDSVPDLSAPYSQLVLEFVADAHEETQQFHDWSRNDTTIVVRIPAGSLDLDLTATIADGGAIETGYTPPGENSFLRVGPCGVEAWVYDDLTTDTTGYRPTLVDWSTLAEQYKSLTTATGEVTQIALQLSEDGPGYRLWVYPAPTATRYMHMRFHSPEALIDVDEDADSRVITTPWRPIVKGAVYWALNERGEEMGEPGGLAEKRFYASLAVEKERDLNLATKTGNLEFYRD